MLSGEEKTLDRVLASGDGDLSVCVMSQYHRTETWCLLTHAAWAGHDHLLPRLLRGGLSLEGRGTRGLTPLMVAAMQDHEKMVEKLLDYGALGGATNEAKE